MKPKPTLFLLLILSTALAHSQVPVFNSYPSAPATIYLDFDGQYVTGTAWNWGGPIAAQPAALTTAAITEIFHRVAEDYRIFNVNVTTDSNAYKAAPFNRRTRVIITPSSAWYGNAGGVAYVGSFTWGDGTPAWVFSNKLGNNTKYIAEACSHEAGHTLGLQHQSTYNGTCGKTAEYYAGQGSGEIGWAPIMGVGYYQNLTTWYNGTNSSGCNVYQNDIDLIADGLNGFGLRTDDHSDTHASATKIGISGTSFSATGIVNRASDVDVFSITLAYAQNFKLTAVPENVGTGNAGADVDIKVSLLNGNGDTIGHYNPSLLLNAGIDTNLLEGTYYLVAEGIGNPNLSDYGSVGYYLLYGELNRVLSLQRFRLTGSAANGVHALNWSHLSNEVIGEFEVQVSQNGSYFEKLVSVDAAQSNITYRPPSTSKVFYRIRAITPDERSYHSNILVLQPGQSEKLVQVMNTMVKEKLTLNSTGNYQYQLLQQNGQLVQRGQIKTGYNSIHIQPAIKGLLMLRVYDGTQYWTEKLMKE
jgi:hypothetical protein